MQWSYVFLALTHRYFLKKTINTSSIELFSPVEQPLSSLPSLHSERPLQRTVDDLHSPLPQANVPRGHSLGSVPTTNTVCSRDHLHMGFSQWETLHCNVISLWLSRYKEWSLVQCTPDTSRLVGSKQWYRDISGSAIYRVTFMSQNPGKVCQRVLSGDRAFVCLAANSARRQRI